MKMKRRIIFLAVTGVIVKFMYAAVSMHNGMDQEDSFVFGRHVALRAPGGSGEGMAEAFAIVCGRGESVTERMEEFIERVKQRAVLYNVNAVGYKDNSARNEAWKEIGAELNMTADECRRQWTKLRNCFTNAIKRRSWKNCQNGRKLAAWTYEEQMSFLLPYVETSNGTLMYVQQADAQHLPEEIVSQFESMDDPLLQSPSYYNERKPKKFKRTSSCYNDELRGTDHQRQYTTLRKEMSEAKLTDLDETDMFYLSMSKTIKHLPQAERARIRLELCKMVSEAEIKQAAYQG